MAASRSAIMRVRTSTAPSPCRLCWYRSPLWLERMYVKSYSNSETPLGNHGLAWAGLRRRASNFPPRLPSFRSCFGSGLVRLQPTLPGAFLVFIEKHTPAFIPRPGAGEVLQFPTFPKPVSLGAGCGKFRHPIIPPATV